MDDNTINTAEPVEAAAEEVQTEPTGSAAETPVEAPEEKATESADDEDIDIGIDIENAYVDQQPEKILLQQAKAKGMTVEQYSEYVAKLEYDAEVNRLMNEEGLTVAEATREAKYNLLEKKLKAQEDFIKRSNRYVKEIREFKELFPDVDRKKFPKEVWEAVEAGTDISSAYAKYARREELKAEKAEKANAANKQTATPQISKSAKADRFYTEEELSRMSTKEMMADYDRVWASYEYHNKK
ncbi:MAG: hypothetical protein II777_10585 [Clostridia bacterium]|nr:hypothetical protein [Clostridia bacterium]